MQRLASIRFVLVSPTSGGNVGAAARALKNMGLSELVLVAPHLTDQAEAVRMAHNAEDVLAAARTVDTLGAALADCRWSVGTTRRTGERRPASYTPHAFAAAVQASPARRPLAIVFGPERDGLSGSEIDQCQDVLHIPAVRAHPSLNLAQAVVIVAYELYQAALDSPGFTDVREPEATAAEIEAQFEQLRKVMLAIGYARPETVEHALRDIRHLLARGRPRHDEIAALRGLWRQTLWAVTQREPEA